MAREEEKREMVLQQKNIKFSAIETASKIKIFMNSKSKDCCSQIKMHIKSFTECKANV